MRRSCHEIVEHLKSRLSVGTSQPISAWRPSAAAIQRSCAVTGEKLVPVANLHTSFGVRSAGAPHLPSNQTPFPPRTPSRARDTFARHTPENGGAPIKSDTPALDTEPCGPSRHAKVQIWDGSQHQIRASSIPPYAFGLLTKLKLAGNHRQLPFNTPRAIHKFVADLFICRPRRLRCWWNCAGFAAWPSSQRCGSHYLCLLAAGEHCTFVTHSRMSAQRSTTWHSSASDQCRT